MKKPYFKPELVYECFELSQSIAANCQFIAHHTQRMCSIDIGGGFTIFAGKMCQFTPAPDDPSICYDVPNGEGSVFSS